MAVTAGGFLAAGASTALAQGPATSITLSGTIRDFKDSHPDFERDEATDRGIVQTSLGPDKKPVYAPAGQSPTTSGAATFSQWYRDVSGVNRSKPLDLAAQLVPGSSPATYRFQSPEFFPIDGQLFGNQGREHNFHFTYELNGRFTYQGGEVFEFRGDDDVWVFINNRLVIDLGGIHATQSASLRLDDVAQALGLQAGQSYDFDLFFAERSTSRSSFQFDTTVALQPAAPPSGPPLQSGDVAGSPATGLGQPAGAVCASVPPRRSSKKSEIRLTKAALVIQQRIDAAALRRLNAANAWIDAGITPADLCGNGTGAPAFQSGITWGNGPAGSDVGPPTPRPLRIVKKSKPPAKFTLSRSQVAINDRISRALLARANATETRLSALTGGNLADGATITSRPRTQDPVAGAPIPQSSEPPATPLRIGALAPAGKISFSAAQLKKTQQRSQRAIVIANRVNDRIGAGLTEQQFRQGSIGAGRIE